MLVRNREQVEPVTYSGEAHGVEMRPLITQADGAPHFGMRVFTLEPHGHTPYHTHDWEHEVYVLAGAGIVRSTSGDRPLHAGDSLFIAPFEAHQLRAGTDGLQFICCVPHHE